MRAPNRRKRGFTLIETVVTVGIVAAMAAIVIPQVVNQMEESEPARIQNDLKNLQTAIETFNVNVKTAPGDLDDLVNTIDANDSLLASSGYSTALNSTVIGYWAGPYVDFSLIDIFTGDASRPTASGANILDSFVCYNAATNTTGTSEGVSSAHTSCEGTGQKFLAIQVTGLASASTDANFIALNQLFDDHAAETTAGTTATAGRVRFKANAATAQPSATLTQAVVYFLAIPLS